MSQIPAYENFAKCDIFICCLDESLYNMRIDELPDSHELKTYMGDSHQICTVVPSATALAPVS